MFFYRPSAPDGAVPQPIFSEFNNIHSILHCQLSIFLVNSQFSILNSPFSIRCRLVFLPRQGLKVGRIVAYVESCSDRSNTNLSTSRCVPDGTQAALLCFFYRPFAPGGALIPSIFLTKRHSLSILHSQFSILNSPLSILNSQFSIPHSQFSTLNSQFSTLNSQFSILNSPLSILNSPLSTLNSFSPPA